LDQSPIYGVTGSDRRLLDRNRGGRGAVQLDQAVGANDLWVTGTKDRRRMRIVIGDSPAAVHLD